MKPLKILLGNNTLSLLAGSETWTYTLAVQLKRMGHMVHCFSPTLGIISENLEKEGIPSFDHFNTDDTSPFSTVLEEKIDHEYDVIIANHNHIVDFLRSSYPKTPIISTIHGIIHTAENDKGEIVIAPEHPALNAGVNQFIAVSEEIQEKLKKDHNIDSIIIRNFFDIKDLKIGRSISKGKPKQFLINSNYTGKDEEQVSVIREVAKHYGAKLTAIGYNFSQAIDIKPALRDADIVIGMGRSVLEGVAAGRLGIVHGRWGTGGIICEGNIDDIRRCNFSGRNSQGISWTKGQFIEHIDRLYNSVTAEWGKKYISMNHNSAFAAEEYVRIARELLGHNIIREVQPVIRKYKKANA